jgi:cell division septum initiation protein DivIVA
VVVIDSILQLIDRLEALVTDGLRFPLTSKAVVDEQEFLDIIDQLRVAVPEEIKQAKRVTVEKDRVIGGAQTEAEKIVNAAQEQVASMLKDNEIIKTAEQHAQSIIADAQEAAREIRDGADAYAIEVLGGLEGELARLNAKVRKGRATLEQSPSRLDSN